MMQTAGFRTEQPCTGLRFRLGLTILLVVSVIGDLMFITSFFILGGDFWDKIRSLFTLSAKAQFNSSA